jgi:hypothetical protein
VLFPPSTTISGAPMTTMDYNCTAEDGCWSREQNGGPRCRATSNRRTSDDNSNRLHRYRYTPEMHNNGFSDEEPSRAFKKEHRVKALYVGTRASYVVADRLLTSREAHDFCLLPTAHWHAVASIQRKAASPSQSEPKTRSNN